MSQPTDTSRRFIRAAARWLGHFGVRSQNLAYLLEHPPYRVIRRNGGSRDIFRLLEKPWLPRDRIKSVLDVGANDGQFARTAQALFPAAAIYAFEPNPEAAERLRANLPSGNLKIFPMACGRERGEAKLQLSRFAPASSLLKSTAQQLAEFPETAVDRAVSVEVQRLDSIMREEHFEPEALLKLDVQGFELEVLQGAEGILDAVAVVVCEVNTAQLYQGQTQMESLLAFLRKANFRVVDIGEPIRSRHTSEVIYVDLAFLRAGLSA